ncbi:MAG TPA: DUF4249 domain-containing protein [Mucilaginibacter sp.]
MGCKKSYNPPAVGASPDHLVVEGNINPGNDSTIIHLTRTLPLSAPPGTLPTPELNATVSVESDANSTYPLTAIGNGYYVSAGLNLNTANNYRLKIITSNNKTYQSDYVPVKNSPPIDSVSFNVQNTGVQVNVSAHDVSNNSRYYRYEYQETWIIHADYDSGLKLIKGVDAYGVPSYNVVLRDPKDEIYQCWSSDNSSTIVLGSTANLTKDVLANSPVVFIDSHSEKIGVRYSILVKQYVLTKEAFEYYQLLSKNTEKIGSIFDPQPSTLTGNIHNEADPSEQVIGYVTAGTFTQQRVYINKYDLPGSLQYFTNLPYNNCFIDSLYFSNPKTGENQVENDLYHGDAVPLWAIQQPGGPLLGYAASGGICVDCTLRGTNVKPSFWIDPQ